MGGVVLVAVKVVKERGAVGGIGELRREALDGLAAAGGGAMCEGVGGEELGGEEVAVAMVEVGTKLAALGEGGIAGRTGVADAVGGGTGGGGSGGRGGGGVGSSGAGGGIGGGVATSGRYDAIRSRPSPTHSSRVFFHP